MFCLQEWFGLDGLKINQTNIQIIWGRHHNLIFVLKIKCISVEEKITSIIPNTGMYESLFYPFRHRHTKRLKKKQCKWLHWKEKFKAEDQEGDPVTTGLETEWTQ